MDKLKQAVDILILSNGPGEVSTWVRPVVKALRQVLGDDRSQVRISVILAPCTHAMGTETAIVRNYPEVDRTQSPEHFFSFLLWGKTAENWDWHKKGIIIFLGGDQFFPVIIGKRLGYATVIYAEWEARWYRWIDRFAVLNSSVIKQIPAKYQHKLTVVGDLMVDIPYPLIPSPSHPLTPSSPLIAILPGSKPGKLDQGVPLCLTIAEHIHAKYPQSRFIIPVAPTLDLMTLAKFANPQLNPIINKAFWTHAELFTPEQETPYLKTHRGLKIELITQFPSHTLLSQCHLALTTVGANTAELATLGVPMIVLLPTQRLDAMRTWDGIPGILAHLPGVGSIFAKLINFWVMRKKRLFAWPNIWANEEIVPELLGELQADDVAQIAINWLEHPETLADIRSRLRQVGGQSGASEKIAQIVTELVFTL